MLNLCLREFSDFTGVFSPGKVLCNGPLAGNIWALLFIRWGIDPSAQGGVLEPDFSFTITHVKYKVRGEVDTQRTTISTMLSL